MLPSFDSRRTLLMAAILLAMIAPMATLHAQWGRSGDNILYPQNNLPFFIGPEVGWGLWSHKADFGVGDSQLPCTIFSDGKGSGLTAGLRAMLYLSDWLVLTPRVRYESRPGTFTKTLPDQPIRDESNDPAMLSQEAESQVESSSLTLDLMVGVDIGSTGFYVMGGLGSGLMMQGTFDYTERITAPADMVYDDTGTNEHLLVQEQKFQNYESPAFALRGGAGYLLKLGQWGLNPEVFYSLPLTSALGAPDELKQSGIVVSMGILLNLRGSE
jgi:hypothetical protein